MHTWCMSLFLLCIRRTTILSTSKYAYYSRVSVRHVESTRLVCIIRARMHKVEAMGSMHTLVL